MFYREAGLFKTTYQADQAVFPIPQDRIFVIGVVLAAFFLVPLVANDYWYEAVLIQFLVFAVAAIGLNLLTGYAGQVSLGTGGFMACGAVAAMKILTHFPDTNIIVVFMAAGLITAAVGVFFGLPSLRIKGFYLAVATLAAHFFLLWLFNKAPYFYNFDSSGTIFSQSKWLFGIQVTGPEAAPVTRYLFALTITVLMAVAAKNLVRGRVGRSWMAIRDMDIAAELIGIRPLQTKLLAFAISSFYCGVAGAMTLYLWLGSIEVAEAFELISTSFAVLFMVIIGGLGSILGSFIGAAFIVLLPIFLTNFPPMIGLHWDTALLKHLEEIIFGGLIVFFLIVEPAGIARLWSIVKEKLRRWPFPY